MQIISFSFFGLVAVLYIALYLLGKAVTDDTQNVFVTNALLLGASYVFLIYVDIRFACRIRKTYGPQTDCRRRKRIFLRERFG